MFMLADRARDIVATGAKAFTPVGMYGYAGNENVVTRLELEQFLKKGEPSRPKRVVMIPWSRPEKELAEPSARETVAFKCCERFLGF